MYTSVRGVFPKVYGAGFWNAMRLYPERDRGVVVMANTTAAYDIDDLCQAAVNLS